MSEVIHSNPQQTAEFLRNAGYQTEPHQIVEVFPSYFPDRRVLRIENKGNESSRVLKVRPNGTSAQREIRNLHPLLASYRFSGTQFGGLKVDQPQNSKFVVINMPYLGVDITNLGRDLELVELGYANSDEVTFRGFSDEQIRQLVKILRDSQMAFASHHKLIHGDVFQMKSPNNIVFNETAGRLLLVDAEALAEADESSIDRFNEGVGYVEEWMYRYLLR